MLSIQIFRRPLALFLTFLMVMTTLSCYSRRQLKQTRLNKINLENLQFVVIDASARTTSMWKLSNVAPKDSALTAHFERAPAAYAQQIASIRNNGDRGANQDKVLIYVQPKIAKTYQDSFDAQLNFSDIYSIEVFEPDAGKVVAIIFGVLGGIALAALIALAIACACPYVYTETSTGPQLAGELYAGAAYPQLERHDWLPLPVLEARDGQYTITLTNELYENQHTNLLELEVLDAPPGVRPLYDKYGQLHTISAPQQPDRATDGAGQDVLPQLLQADKNVFRGDQNNQRPDATEYLTLSFPKPADAREAKLVLQAKNSIWMDYIYYEFQNELGVYGPKIRQKYLKKSAAENRRWLEDQKIPLAVWLETTPGQWKKVDYFNVAGSLAYKTDVLPIDLTEVQGNSVRLRLEFGFNFWEIDYAALDFSTDIPVTRHRLSPATAITESGADVASALQKDDALYYDQPNIADAARVSFTVPPQQAGQVRSLILHAKGHYEIKHQPAGGRPGYFQLKSWEKANALPRLSRERWLEARQQLAHSGF